MTIKDLAAQTGYSVGTVSRVLNHQPHVSEQAREIILRAAEESGFQLNSNAKQLKQQHGTSILAICKSHQNMLFDELLVSIQARIARSVHPLVVDYIDETENEVQRAVQLCREKKPLGVLFLGGNQENFQKDFYKIEQPCVLVTSSAAELPFDNLSSVSSDDVQAARMAIEHLVELGHRKIVVIGGSRQTSDAARLRYQGCQEAFREHGLIFDEELDYETSRFTYLAGYHGAQALLERERAFTALFAMSDVMAIGAIRALNDAGKRVPEDVSVMGLDGLTIGEYTVPRLTTVAQDVEDLAERSLELLRCCIEDRGLARHEIVPVTLQSKESTRRIR
ncbi:MAG: LacI family DNA-binding transcriptional regulator [Faecousia sp.]